mgnify:CR=1 FL=1
MENVYVFEGKTSTEAIEKGLKELNTTKDKVEIDKVFFLLPEVCSMDLFPLL